MSVRARTGVRPLSDVAGTMVTRTAALWGWTCWTKTMLERPDDDRHRHRQTGPAQLAAEQRVEAVPVPVVPRPDAGEIRVSDAARCFMAGQARATKPERDAFDAAELERRQALFSIGDATGGGHHQFESAADAEEWVRSRPGEQASVIHVRLAQLQPAGGVMWDVSGDPLSPDEVAGQPAALRHMTRSPHAPLEQAQVARQDGYWEQLPPGFGGPLATARTRWVERKL